ncbi:UNVERIFIED_CONTAM: hypothetical protein PYX00_006191 [Menopon gallinae]|uniref:Uncharacterized protein n=1 Tax=Menopon gallinae TaxID=328185 RepID=A0AAW2HUJ7_9NEOP
MTDIPATRTHREWRRMAKKMRRKRIRQRLAEVRNAEQRKREKSPTYLTELAKKKLLEEYELEEYEKERKERHEKWLKAEEEAQRLWREQQRIKELAKEEKMRELERIRSEWEAEQQKVKKRKEEMERLKEEEEKRKQRTLERVNDFIVNGGEVPEELMAIRETNSGKELCSFFSKVGSCRFGPQCSRNHQYPSISKVLLFSNFYSHFTLDQSHSSEYDTDIGLEFEDSDMYLHFTEFYKDVAPELKKYGTVKMIKVCCNTESHLRGNVYVEYSSLRDALVAYQKFHGRWYGDWGRAVCGDFARRRCPKGKSCNFLHVFRNPRNEYPIEWNRVKNTNSHSPTDSFNGGSPDRDRSFRWSETPVRRVPESDRNGHRHRSRSRERRERRSHRRDDRKRRSSHSERSSKKPRMEKD